MLPRTHGSSLFTRGETQSLVTTTLGTSQDAQHIEALTGNIDKRFMLHYNFPPFSTGETKPLRGASRREVGHGNLAERAIARVLPGEKDFPYTIRIVSEILESNGSSSMASVCGGILSLMDGGVPIKTPVAGIAMGLIKEGDRVAVLSDILGDEDHLGDMDFKICGSKQGVTAVQMDIKIQGLTREILEKALHQAREGRIHILGKMAEALAAPREDLSRYAPRIHTLQVKPDQIREIIGPGGKTIRGITAQTGVSIEVEDDGTVHIASPDGIAVKKAIDIIKGLTTEPEMGEFYMGVVKRLADFGAFVEILPGTDGLVHISELDEKRVRRGAGHLQGGRRDAGQGDRHRPRHRQDPPVPARGARQDARRRPQLPRSRVLARAGGGHERAAGPVPEAPAGRARAALHVGGGGRAGSRLGGRRAHRARARRASRGPDGAGLRDPAGLRGAGPPALGPGAQVRDHPAERPRDHRQRLPGRGPGLARRISATRRTWSRRATASRSSSSHRS